LAPYLAGGGLTASAVATSIAFLLIGSLKSRWSMRSAWISAFETLAIGGIAAALAYAAGHVLAVLLA
jgi:VIT1/CCC1 family predicted Fe2+/Mn2+ transporter